MIEAHRFDGMICIPNCDKIVPGMFMGAMRVNVPTVFVSGGPMEAGKTESGKSVDLIDAFVAGVKRQNNQISAEELDEIEKAACPTCGSCSGMFTANSMNCLAEALGMGLPGNGTILATSADRKSLYERAAKRIVEMAKEFGRQGEGHGLLPREIANPRGLRQCHDSGHGDGWKHEHRAPHPGHRSRSGRRVLDAADRRAEQAGCQHLQGEAPPAPITLRTSPGQGGIRTILGEVERGRPGLLTLSCSTVTGKTLGENIADYDVRNANALATAKTLTRGPSGRRAAPPRPGPYRAWLPSPAPRRPDTALLDSEGENLGDNGGNGSDGQDGSSGFDPFDVIRTVEKAYSQSGGLTMLYSNLAPEGAVVKTAGVDPKMLKHSGPAVIFENEQDAYNGIVFDKVKAGDVVVIPQRRSQGGTGDAGDARPDDRHQGSWPGRQVCLDHRRPLLGGTAGASIGHISPEAAVGGPIGLLRDGDIVEIDIPAGRLSVQLSDEELAARRAAWKAPAPGSRVVISPSTRPWPPAPTPAAILKWD